MKTFETFERLTDAEQWELLIPEMGYMALLRNLRNFDQAGISESAASAVAQRLAAPAQVAKSMQFPFRFLSAYQATDSVRWAPALEAALDLSVNNVPAFSGRTLVLVDTSGSMQSPVGGSRSQAMRCDVAALFGAVLAARNVGNVDLHIYATNVAPLQVPAGASILRSVERMRRLVGSVGHGTNTWQAVNETFNGQDRIIVLTDEQSHDYGKNPGAWMHFINLAGYKAATAPEDRKTFAYGGFTDSMFRLLPLSEQGAAGQWPWE